MSKVDNAKYILAALQVPDKQQSNICCYTLLALANMLEESRWSSASNRWMRIHDIIVFLDYHYKQKYAENSREVIRKQAMHHFRNAAFIEDNGLATNNPNYSYRLTNEMLRLVQSYGSAKWSKQLASFTQKHQSLIALYASKRFQVKMPVQINGTNFTFSPGKHNQLQKAIIEEFAPRFAHYAECLYIGDTVEKELFKNNSKLKSLGFSINVHDKLPDVILYSAKNRWLYFIEAVTSVGPIDPKRVQEIKAMTSNVNVGKIYITAFLDFKTFKRFADCLAWETEVWIAETPDHIIHFNGNRLLSPYEEH